MCFCLCLVVQWLWSGDCGQEAQWWFGDCSHEAQWWYGSNLVGFVGWFGGFHGLIWWVSVVIVVQRFVGLIWWVSGSGLVGLGCLYQRCLGDGDDESRRCYWWVSGMVVVDGLLRSGRGNGATMEVFLFCFFWLGLDCWWIVGFDCWGNGVVGFFFFFFCYYGLWLWPMVVQT